MGQIFRIYFLNHLIKNPQTTTALTFLTYIISAVSGVMGYVCLAMVFCTNITLCLLLSPVMCGKDFICSSRDDLCQL